MNDELLLVRDLMSEDIVALTPSDDMALLADILTIPAVRQVLVVEPNGRFVGLVDKADLDVGSWGEGMSPGVRREILLNHTIAEIMRRSVPGVAPNTPLGKLSMPMLDNAFDCVPVVEDGMLVGVITKAQFTRYLAKAA